MVTPRVAISHFLFGVSVGANASNFRGLPEEFTTQNGLNYQGGLFGHFRFGNFPLGDICLQPEILWSRGGATLKKTITDSFFKLRIFENKFLTDYIDIPVALGFNFNLGEITPFIQVVPYLGINVNTSNHWVETTNSPNQNIELEKIVSNQYNRGIKYRLGVSVNRVSLSMAYNHGLANVAKGLTSDFYHSTIEVSFSYTIFDSAKE